MEELLKIFFVIAMFSPLLVFVAVAIVYSKFRVGQMTSQHRSVIFFLLGIVLIGVVVGPLGVVAGLEIFCSPGAGAQCGLGGFFFTGPLAFSLAAAIYLWLWARRCKSV